MSGLGGYLPGLGAPAPGIDTISAAAATVAAALANSPVGQRFVTAAKLGGGSDGRPARPRIRITQKA